VTSAFFVFSFLLVFRASGFWGFLLQHPGSFDVHSVRLILSHAFWPLSLALLFWAAAWALGRLALGVRGRSTCDGPSEIVAASLGLGLLGQGIFFLGWAGGLSPAGLGLFSGLALLAAIARLPLEFRMPARLHFPSGAAAGLMAFTAVCTLLSALAPPVAWDVRAYHLALPEIALRAGRFAVIPWMLHSHWPHLMEALYVLPLAVGRDAAAALIHWGAAALLVAGVFYSARSTGGRAAAWTSALLLAAQPAFQGEAGSAHSDGAAALFAFAAATALARWEETDSRRWLAIAGLLAGFGAACKLTLLAPLCGWAFWLAAVRRRPRQALLLLACGGVVAGPWLMKTWMETGDPVWPFLSGVLGRPIDAALAARNHLSNRWGWPPPLWALTQDAPGYLLIPAAGLWVLAKRSLPRMSSEEKWLWIASPFLSLLVFREHAAWRYLMPVWPALALACGRAAASAFGQGEVRKFAAAAMVAVGLVPLVSASPNNELFAAAALRPTSAPGADRRLYWEDRFLEHSAFCREARAALPPGAKVLFFREIRGYGVGFDYLWGDPVNQALVDYRELRDPEALFKRLRALGVTHVLDHASSGLYGRNPGYYDGRTLALMRECLLRHADVVLARAGISLHRLRSSPR